MSPSYDDEGTAIVEFVWLSVLLLIPLVYVVLGVFEVQRTALAASTAARSAGRAFLTAPTEASARGRAERAALPAARRLKPASARPEDAEDRASLDGTA